MANRGDSIRRLAHSLHLGVESLIVVTISGQDPAFTSTHTTVLAMHNLKHLGMMLFIALNPFAASFAAAAPEPVVTPLMSKDTPDVPGREMLMLSVEYPPGAVEHIHRHDAYAFVYVLEGSVVEQVRGGKEVTLTPGQTFYEGPNDVHTVGRNASTTKPAKFVVVLLKQKGTPAVLPAE